jgi:maleate isomerase
MNGNDPQPRRTPSIGLILPFDSALDREFWQYLPDNADLFVSRTPHISGPLGVPLISAVSEPSAILSVAADMALALDPDVVVYACTSGSFIRGVDACMLLRTDMEGRGCRRAGSTSEFLLEALAHMGAKTVAVGTPYDDEMAGLLLEFLREGGIEPVSVENLGITGDPKTVPSDAVFELARAADAADADVLFLSCTNLRTFELLPDLEAELGKPVLTANQVSMWGALRRAGIPAPSIDQALFSQGR